MFSTTFAGNIHSLQNFHVGSGLGAGQNAYDFLQDLSSSDLAWEFLRRNADYRADFANQDLRAALDAGAANVSAALGVATAP